MAESAQHSRLAEVQISIVMTTYNGRRYIREQIESIICQMSEYDELIISDDGSSDDTLAILGDYVSDRVNIHRTTGRMGPILNFEFALSHAHGEVIVLADQDDRWLPGRLQRVRDYFAASTSAHDLLVMNSIITDGRLNPTEGSLFSYLNAGPGLVKNVCRNTYVGCHMAFRRALLSVAMPFPPAIPMHDVWLGLVSERLGSVTFDPEPTLLFRRSGHNHTKARYPFRQRLIWRIGLIASLMQLGFRARRRPIPSSRRKPI